jgi:hypothetical protein
MMADVKAQIEAILGEDAEIRVLRLVQLFDQLNVNRCDFDCDNCHNGGCGNHACDRGGCPEENAARDAEDKAWAAAQAEGHTVLGCQTCMTSVCRLVDND